jgi:uncharacterized protein (TIGR03067 family)
MKPAVWLFLVGVALAGCTAKDQGPQSAFDQDLATLQGTWRPVSMKQDGKFLPEERIGQTRLTIEGEKFTFDTGRDSHGGLYKIDPSKDPKQLDITS